MAKNKIAELESAALDGAMEKYAELCAERAELAASLERAKAEIVSRYGGQSSRLGAEIAAQETMPLDYAKRYKAEFKPRQAGGNVRSYEHGCVAVGFRLDPPKVRIEDEPAAIEWLQRFDDGAYIRVKVEPNREAIREALANDADERTVERMAAHGITLQQKDRAFVEYKP